jgi:hypothetical protein
MTNSTRNPANATGGAGISSLKTRLGAVEPGQKVSVTWTDASGSSQTATVTLATGPAD